LTNCSLEKAGRPQKGRNKSEDSRGFKGKKNAKSHLEKKEKRKVKVGKQPRTKEHG